MPRRQIQVGRAAHTDQTLMLRNSDLERESFRHKFNLIFLCSSPYSLTTYFVRFLREPRKIIALEKFENYKMLVQWQLFLKL